MEKMYTTDIAELHYKNQILYTTFNCVDISIAEAKSHITDLKREFQNVLPALSIANISAIKNSSKEARDYLGTPEVVTLLKANAVVANSTLSKIIVNLYLMFNKPSVPTKIFTDEAAALAWLTQFK
jgi:hypothetical protein